MVNKIKEIIPVGVLSDIDLLYLLDSDIHQETKVRKIVLVQRCLYLQYKNWLDFGLSRIKNFRWKMQKKKKKSVKKIESLYSVWPIYLLSRNFLISCTFVPKFSFLTWSIRGQKIPDWNTKSFHFIFFSKLSSFFQSFLFWHYLNKIKLPK